MWTLLAIWLGGSLALSLLLFLEAKRNMDVPFDGWFAYMLDCIATLGWPLTLPFEILTEYIVLPRFK